jgi:hypothetical protein
MGSTLTASIGMAMASRASDPRCVRLSGAMRALPPRDASNIGRESNRLEGVQAGLVEGLDEVVNRYDDFYERVFAPLVLPVLRTLGVRETARRTGHSVGAVSAALSQGSGPRRRQLRRYAEVAVGFAAERSGDRAPQTSLRAAREPGGADDVGRRRLEALSHRLPKLH